MGEVVGGFNEAAVDPAVIQSSASRASSAEWPQGNEAFRNRAVWEFTGKAIAAREGGGTPRYSGSAQPCARRSWPRCLARGRVPDNEPTDAAHVNIGVTSNRLGSSVRRRPSRCAHGRHFPLGNCGSCESVPRGESRNADNRSRVTYPVTPVIQASICGEP